MEKLASPYYFSSLILTACLGSLSIGYQFGIYNTCSSSIATFFDFASNSNKQLYEGLITSSLTMGGVIGSFYSSSLMQTGRRRALLITDALSILSILMCFFPGVFFLVLARLLVGVSLGLNSVIVPIFIKEFSPTEISGTTGSIHSVFISAGVLISFFFGFLLPYNDLLLEHGFNLWRILFCFPVIISFTRAFLLVQYFPFETPSFLWKKHKQYEAKTILERLFVEEQSFEFLKAFSKSSPNVHYRDLFGPCYVKQMEFGLILSAVQQFSGINALIFYSNQIFMQEGNETTAVIFTFMIGIILTITAIISGKFMDFFGRRKAMIVGVSCSVFCIGMLILLKPTTMAYLIKYLILAFVFSFGISQGPILWVYLAETLPDKGVSLASLVNWLSCLIVALIFPKMITSLGFETTFGFFFICGAFGLLYIWLNMIETKGKTSMEIQKLSEYDSEENPHLIIDRSFSKVSVKV